MILGSRARWLAVLAAAQCALLALAAPVRGQIIQDEVPEQARGLDIEEKLGAAVPMGAELVSVDGSTVRLGEFFDGQDGSREGRPTILVLAYYDCPVACPAMLGNLNRAFNGLEDWTIGREFNVLVVSFDPTNTAEQARAYATRYRSGYERNAAEPETVAGGYRFFRASADTSRAIADSVGFGFRYLPEVNEYAHATGVVLLGPDGTVSRYFYGFDYQPRELRLALLDAAKGRIGKSFGDRVLLFCYSYDPSSNSYTVAAFRIMQAGAVASALLVGGLVVGLKLSERVRQGRRDTDRDVDGRSPTRGGVAAGAGA